MLVRVGPRRDRDALTVDLNEVRIQYIQYRQWTARKGREVDQEYRIILTCDQEKRKRWCNIRLVEQRVSEKKERTATESTAGQTKLGSTGRTGRPKAVGGFLEGAIIGMWSHHRSRGS